MTFTSAAKNVAGAMLYAMFVLAIVASGALAAASLAGIVTWW